MFFQTSEAMHAAPAAEPALHRHARGRRGLALPLLAVPRRRGGASALGAAAAAAAAVRAVSRDGRAEEVHGRAACCCRSPAGRERTRAVAAKEWTKLSSENDEYFAAVTEISNFTELR